MNPSLNDLFPLIVPAEYVANPPGWNLPHILFRAPDLILTWVVLYEASMVYLTDELAEKWKSDCINWQLIAFENIRRNTGKCPATHEKLNENGVRQWVAMMHPDGLGSSRLLISEGLSLMFPEGYWPAIPERSLGLALSARADSEHRDAFLDLVKGCHRKGRVPMLDRLLSPDELEPLTQASP